MIKRIAIAAAAGATVFTVALASASALDINSAEGQVGSASLTGDADGVVVESYGVELDTEMSPSVKLSGIDENLVGKEILIEAYGPDKADGKRSSVAKTGKVVVVGDGEGDSEQTFKWTTPVDLKKIETITIAVD